jgi:type II secretory ATPase GspE/PulE/Tfp pilus assembly ATPase PilB-like protein
VNIMTLEDPIEYVMAGINQIEVGTSIGLDFAEGLKLILRLNPDIVFVGEIRDAQTAKIAVQASLTGHLVISTIHARNSLGALYRLLNLGVDPYMVNYAVRAILSQRLLRKLCDHCKAEQQQVTEAEKKAYQKEAGRLPKVLYTANGCELCNHTKYHQRIGIFELMEMDDKLKQLVTSGASENQMRDELIGAGFEDMAKEGIRLVDNGMTSLEEYLRVMYDAR